MNFKRLPRALRLNMLSFPSEVVDFAFTEVNEHVHFLPSTKRVLFNVTAIKSRFPHRQTLRRQKLP